MLLARELQLDPPRPGFWKNLQISLILALETIVDHARPAHPDGLLGAPEAAAAAAGDRLPGTAAVRRAADHPRRRPARRLQAAADWFYAEPYGFLVAAYVILAFPYIYFALDAGFRAIDVHTLTEASQSLGASWPTTLLRVILPNIRVAALAGAFLTLAIVMGEFTIASLAHFDTFPIYMQYINQNKAYPAAAVTADQLRDHVGWRCSRSSSSAAAAAAAAVAGAK